jgi:tetratricopeptide (TPR) repeat protein
VATKQLSQIKEANAATTRALADSEEARKQADAVSRFLIDTFQRSDPEQDGRELKVADLLTSAATKLHHEFTGSPKIKGALLSALGQTLDKLGLPAQAVDVLKKAVAAQEAALGPDNEDTLATRTALAEVYLTSDLSAETLPLFEELLRAHESTLGADHWKTLGIQEDLAMAYQKTGDLARAIPLFERTLLAQKSKFGPTDGHRLNSQNNLASALSDAGRHAEAIELFNATLKAREATLAPDQPLTLTSRNNLAFALTRAGRAAESIPLLEATLKVAESKLGPDHPQTTTTRNNLAKAYFVAGRFDRSVPLSEVVLKQTLDKLGPDNARTLKYQFNVGATYVDVGRHSEGVRLLEDALRRAHGRSDALEVVKNAPAYLGRGYLATGQYAKAEAVYRELLAQARKSYGPKGPRTVAAMCMVGLTVLKQRRWSEAEPMLRECLATLEKTQRDAAGIFVARSQLGESLFGQGKYAEAESLVVSAYEGLKAREATIPRVARPRLAEAAERVIRLYEQWGRPAEAAAWRVRLGVAYLDTLMPSGTAAFAPR